jgi:hypothetical protein
MAHILRAGQFRAACFGLLARLQSLPKDLKLDDAEGPFHAKDQLVVEIVQIVDLLLVGDQGSKNLAHLQQTTPVFVRARQSRGLSTEPAPRLATSTRRRQHEIQSIDVYCRDDNKESQRLQYEVAERIHALGWKEVEIINSDLGSSAAIASARREGFERVLSSVALGEVGNVGSSIEEGDHG